MAVLKRAAVNMLKHERLERLIPNSKASNASQRASRRKPPASRDDNKSIESALVSCRDRKKAVRHQIRAMHVLGSSTPTFRQSAMSFGILAKHWRRTLHWYLRCLPSFQQHRQACFAERAFGNWQRMIWERDDSIPSRISNLTQCFRCRQ